MSPQKFGGVVGVSDVTGSVSVSDDMVSENRGWGGELELAGAYREGREGGFWVGDSGFQQPSFGFGLVRVGGLSLWWAL